MACMVLVLYRLLKKSLKKLGIPLCKRGIKGDFKSLSISLYEREKFLLTLF